MWKRTDYGHAPAEPVTRERRAKRTNTAEGFDVYRARLSRLECVHLYAECDKTSVSGQLSTFVQLTKELFKFRTLLFEQSSANDTPSSLARFSA